VFANLAAGDRLENYLQARFGPTELNPCAQQTAAVSNNAKVRD
jgi:hypothetical protein